LDNRFLPDFAKIKGFEPDFYRVLFGLAK